MSHVTDIVQMTGSSSDTGIVVVRWSQSTKLTYIGRLVLVWVTVSRFNPQCESFISVRDQQPRSAQPGHPFVGRYDSCVGGIPLLHMGHI